MSIEVPRSLVEFILLGPEDDRRQLQDSPILGDVWVQFAQKPNAKLDLLITPYKEHAAGAVASELIKCKIPGAKIAYLQGIVAGRFSFEDILRFIIPMTTWWDEKLIAGAVKAYLKDPASMIHDVKAILVAADNWLKKEPGAAMQDLETRKRYIALAGLILWAQDQEPPEKGRVLGTSSEQILWILEQDIAPQVSHKLRATFDRMRTPEKSALVYQVSLNRRASPALTKSVPAVKADAARTLFTVDCSDIVWAVIDSGIDATHYAFTDKKGETRVKKTFDFTAIRDIVSLDGLADDGEAEERIKKLLDRDLQNPPEFDQARKQLRELARDAEEGRSINWELVERLVEIKPGTRSNQPHSNHGTHVGGIIAARKEGAKDAKIEDGDAANGMCPDISLYDFRVLGPNLQETEFAIIAALQYIRYVNERYSYMTIHGANLSLSIPHDVRNYACGRTPVCNECERLVNSGVVVVAAAGNRGYQNFETKDGQYESYAAFSVTDPGNADGVITVGATHRFWPHTYGVSFFSSRGPTGDGRLKPDLVAPGERIRAPIPGKQWGDLDGTSMAAPHVSGAAAMLMARYSELIGQPRRIKEILCKSATDLGRERSFQGHGMLDVLRAFQTI